MDFMAAKMNSAALWSGFLIFAKNFRGFSVASVLEPSLSKLNPISQKSCSFWSSYHRYWIKIPISANLQFSGLSVVFRNLNYDGNLMIRWTRCWILQFFSNMMRFLLNPVHLNPLDLLIENIKRFPSIISHRKHFK